MNAFCLDLRSLALFRIALGMVILIDLLIRATDLRAFYSDAGVLPRAALLTEFPSPWHFSLHLATGHPALQAALFLMGAFFAVLLIAGWHTRTAVALSWLWITSLHARNPMVLQGGDVLLRLLAFWGMFLPLSACWSLDARARAGGEAGTRAALVPSLAFALQIAFVYWFSVAHKVGGANAGGIWWPKGEALYYALSIDQFATPITPLLLGLPGLMKALSYGVLTLEALGPLLLFLPVWQNRFRLVAALCLPVLQLAFASCLRLGPFPFVASVAMLPFLPASLWDRWAVEGLRVPVVCGGALWKRLARDVAAGAFIGYVFLWNMGDVDRRFLLPKQTHWIGRSLGLEQLWNMFSPPLTDDGWYVMPGRLRSGAVVDVFAGGGPVDRDKPRDVSELYKNERWRKYLMNLWLERNAGHRPHYARYLCREWNGAHGAADQVLGFEIVFMREDTPAPGQAQRPATPVSVWKQSCF